MKNKTLSLLTASAIALGCAMPSFADGALKDVAGFFGVVTATIIDVPEGILVDSLWRTPVKTSKTLADKFGDDKGLGQQLAGALIGVPVGVVWGVPAGIIDGGRHAWASGWDKPFSTESYLVSEEK